MEENGRNRPISCYIIDDEQEAVNRLRVLIDKIPCMEIYGWETDPEKAVAEVSEYNPELVFIDIVMNDKTGFEVIEEIRKHGDHPYFVFVTAHYNYSIRAIKTAAFDYLMKPVDIEELKETIERYKSLRPLTACQNSEGRASFERLSQREKEILQYLVDGQTSAEISDLLCISKNTVDTHRRNILEKTGLKSTTELIRHYLSSFR